MRAFLIALAAVTAVSACQLGNSGIGGGVQINRISSGQQSKVESRMIETVNTYRQSAGLGPVQMNSQLRSAAATHARDMSVQNRPWNFGSDGSSPLLRVQRAGYSGTYIGEMISESFENETQTLAAWMADPITRRIILDPRARSVGVAWHQERSGKLWWVMELGS